MSNVVVLLCVYVCGLRYRSLGVILYACTGLLSVAVFCVTVVAVFVYVLPALLRRVRS